ncbi:major intrinsically disordered NOTCH2-binding receptor 1-like [Betta splendens]|uniref:Major intrinsically disordered NOTCH2-binding receptor 1-like n=1 Tax=Betta splendens TaxID=158456 RepID=A0A6P7NVI9_BETSP|nr:major intrinsically disordered NOTCH2-binding receptor 1-like [Betta splendens]XP_029023952.1 major intrinsically disordered NOTCH2-binding receptor 1-like [Betta splendens]XP_055369181.1 major intrinsically disordered NOTCH2-binding receptor 1-like [Betta splendens]
MDISALPNNNHPEKFLQLDVGMLPATHGMFQVGAVMSSQKHWQNRVYSQREGTTESRFSSPEKSPVLFVDRYLERHITPVTLKSNIKRNPLYMDVSRADAGDKEKSKPSWTVQDYDTQTSHANLTDYLKKDMKTAKDLDFWLEDLYTPGFDSLLKKKQAEQRKSKLCKIILWVTFSVCAILVVIIVPVVVLKQKN